MKVGSAMMQANCGDSMGAALLLCLEDNISQPVFWSSGSYSFSAPSFAILLSLRCRGCVVDESVGDGHPKVTLNSCETLFQKEALDFLLASSSEHFPGFRLYTET